MMQTDIGNKAITRYVDFFRTSRNLPDEGSSSLFSRLRSDAFQRFEQLGIPTLENPNYTDFESVTHSRTCNTSAENIDAYTFMFEAGHLVNEPEKLPQGVIMGSIRTIARENPELLVRYLNGLAETYENALITLNTAFMQDGFFMYVPDNVALEKPVQLISHTCKGVLSSQRNLIVVGENSKVTIIQWNETSLSLANQVTEIYIDQRSAVDYYQIQNYDNGMESVLVRQKEESYFSALTATINGEFIRNNLFVELNGEYSECCLFGMSFPDKQQHIDNFIHIDHIKPNCKSNQLYKNILAGESTGSFSGHIHVFRDAQKTTAFQRNNNILFSDKAQMFTKPQLIIDADDVKCSHGVTIGQIDKEALFYMRARGISEADANVMLMQAFVSEIIAELKNEPIKNIVSELINAKTNQGRINTQIVE